MEYVLTNKNEQVAKLVLNRPEVFNSFNREMAIQLQQQLDDLGQNPDIRCVVITGMGKAFCAGQDLQEAIEPNGPGLEKILNEHYNPIITKLRKIPKPVIAAVNGVAAGAGANIAIACDLVVASDQASFIQAFSKIGLIPDSGGTYFLPRLIGWQRASALMLTGDKISAADAKEMGMIYKVFSQESFTEEVDKIALQISKMPTMALFHTRELLNKSFTNDWQMQLKDELAMQITCGMSYDYQEGVQAFLEKRKPEFKGK